MARIRTVSFVCLGLFFVVSSVLATPAIQTEKASYYVSVDDETIDAGDMIHHTVHVENGDVEPLQARLIVTLEYDGIPMDYGIQFVSASPGETVTEQFVLSTSDVTDRSNLNVGTVIAETGGERVVENHRITILPMAPYQSPLNLFLGAISVFVMFTIVALSVEAMGVTTWIRDAPLKVVVGIFSGALIGVTNEAIWNFFGFLNSGPVVRALVIVFGVLALIAYSDVFFDGIDVKRRLSLRREETAQSSRDDR